MDPNVNSAQHNEISGERFAAWSQRVEAGLIERTGYGLSELPRLDLLRPFASGETPEAAAQALEKALRAFGIIEAFNRGA